MKRIKLSIAALAVVMVLGSAFTSSAPNEWNVVDKSAAAPTPSNPETGTAQFIKDTYCLGTLPDFQCAINVDDEDLVIYREEGL